MDKSIPAKYQNPSFDPYVEVIDLLTDPQNLVNNYKRLQSLSTGLESIAGKNVNENQNEIHSYLGNLRESEEIMIDYIAYIQETRGDLKECKKLLQEKQRDIKTIWLNGIYHGSIAKGFEEIEEIIDNLYSIDLLIKEKLYMKAADVIKNNIKVIDTADYGYTSVSQRIKEAFTKKMKKLSEQILEELKNFLLLKHSSFESELKKYSVVGILNIEYLLNDDEDKDASESISISGLIDALASIEQLNKIDHLHMWDIQSDIQELIKKCFALFPTIPFEEEIKSKYTLESIIPNKSSKETGLKIANSVIAVAALTIKNQFLLKKSLSKYKYQYSVAGIWEKVQKEVINVFRTIVKIPEEQRESVMVDMLYVEEKDSTYSSMLGSILELSTYHFPYLCNPLASYLSQFHNAIQEGSLISWIEEATHQFIEVLKDDSYKMFSACIANNDAFRFNKTNDALFLSCSVVNSNLKTLMEIKSELNEKYVFFIIEIAVSMLSMFFKDLNSLIEKQTKDSRYYTLFLENSEIFQEIRLDPSFAEVRLSIPNNIYNNFTKSLGYLSEKKGILEETENKFLKFNAVGKTSFIGESAKVLSI